jgi:purine catabolism regulator
VLLAEPPGTGAPGAPDAVALLAERAEAAGAGAAEPALVVRDGPRLTVLAADAGAVLTTCANHLRAGEGLAAGLSEPVPAEEAPLAAAQAERALTVARRRDRGLVEHGDIGAGSVLPLLTDEALRSFSEALLRPLHEHDATSRGDLEASLRAWLARHGQWDAAATDLGVHRHTLRYRMRRVEELLGRSLDDPDTRMELWLALKVSDR